MSVDFYVAMPAANWPTASAVQRCLSERAHPVHVKRFPTLKGGGVVNDGALAVIDGKEVYLEGELAPASAISADVRSINERLMAASAPERIGANDVIVSFRTRSPTEIRAASYVISALIVCFNGLGFEPQGNTHGRASFARAIIESAEALKDL
ncbi:hypothetical protein FHS95_002828 [Sphingomonas naasensis]|uniref:Uncharacterized protein n=1 Tax=Sphingomonas naasensis TaxID=1344951 RepID=A0A4S1W6F2_9SPHN|nr:hypothetical protein [Sphingomonas naasensis]NIJ21125.1 hypothetical protein [Sphingomonas naasensis]TGX38289.1 hypothetical protein E5A74_18895 [Sphingomonas naasensis]